MWSGGALFVASLTATVYAYAIGWAAPRLGRPTLWPALAANIAWFLAFALHHSLFARERVKARIARHVPDRLLRSVYVWIASLLWLVVVAGWQVGRSARRRFRRRSCRSVRPGSVPENHQTRLAPRR